MEGVNKKKVARVQGEEEDRSGKKERSCGLVIPNEEMIH